MDGRSAGSLWRHQQRSPSWRRSWILPGIRNQVKTARNGDFFVLDMKNNTKIGTLHDFGHKINRLLTEREGRTGEYWPEVVAVRTEHSEVSTATTKGQYSPVRLEQARLVRCLTWH